MKFLIWLGATVTFFCCGVTLLLSWPPLAWIVCILSPLLGVIAVAEVYKKK